MAMKGDAKSLSFVEDTAVAPEKLRDYIERFLQIVRAPRHRRPASTRTRRSAACTSGRSSTSRPRRACGSSRRSPTTIADLVLEFGGALSGEHGDGLVRGPFMEKMFGPVLYQAFRDRQAHVRPARHLQPRQDRRLRRR